MNDTKIIEINEGSITIKRGPTSNAGEFDITKLVLQVRGPQSSSWPSAKAKSHNKSLPYKNTL